MNVRGFALILTGLLCTCAPPPAADGPAEDIIRRQEEIVAGAYQSLDAAVLDRLLTTDFELYYPGSGNRKDRAAYLSDLASLRSQFPPLTVSLDSLGVSRKEEDILTEGVRSFSWRAGGSPGQYAERFRNQWRYEGGNWKLAQTTLLSTTAR